MASSSDTNLSVSDGVSEVSDALSKWVIGAPFVRNLRDLFQGRLVEF